MHIHTAVPWEDTLTDFRAAPTASPPPWEDALRAFSAQHADQPGLDELVRALRACLTDPAGRLDLRTQRRELLILRRPEALKRLLGDHVQELRMPADSSAAVIKFWVCALPRLRVLEAPPPSAQASRQPTASASLAGPPAPDTSARLDAPATWHDVGRFLTRLTVNLRWHSPVTLTLNDQRCLSALLATEFVEWVAPSSREGVLDWQAWLRDVVPRAPMTNGRMVSPLTPAEAVSLTATVEDIMMVGAVREPDGTWRCKDAQALDLAYRLSDWMGAGSEGDVSIREQVGVQLLRQQAGLVNELLLTDRWPGGELGLVLPPAELLNELLAPTTRAQLILTDPLPDDAWEGALQALPLRSLRLGHLALLGPLAHEQRSCVRQLDLRGIGRPLTDAELPYLRAAVAVLPNLIEIHVPEGTASDGLGDGWAPAGEAPALCLRHTSRLDGLQALDEAAHAWRGYYLSTRMALRRQASQPDMVTLLRFAKMLAVRTGRDDNTGRRLMHLLRVCAADDDVLAQSAEMVRAAEAAGAAPTAAPALLGRLLALSELGTAL